jgi:hypothetical protein
MRTELKSAFDLARNLAPEELPELLGELEQVRAVALARLLTRTDEARPDELLDVTEAAARLHVSKPYLYKNSSRFKFSRRIGRKLLFSSAGLDSYLRKQSR